MWGGVRIGAQLGLEWRLGLGIGIRAVVGFRVTIRIGILFVMYVEVSIGIYIEYAGFGVSWEAEIIGLGLRFSWIGFRLG